MSGNSMPNITMPMSVLERVFFSGKASMYPFAVGSDCDCDDVTSVMECIATYLSPGSAPFVA